MRKFVLGFFVLLFALTSTKAGLPFSTVFKGRAKFDRLVSEARAGNWAALPIGERTAMVGKAMLGTRYRGYTLEIDDRIEAPSVNFEGQDCWTFFEISLAFARMLGDSIRELVTGASAPLHRGGPISRRAMHR